MRLSTVRHWVHPRLRRAVKGGTLGLAGAQLAAAVTVWGVDSLRKRRQPAAGEFPRTDPVAVDVAGSELTVYTYGEDLYAAMLEAIRGGAALRLLRDLHLEGRRRRAAVQARAHRRGRARSAGVRHLRLLRQPRRAVGVQTLP